MDLPSWLIVVGIVLGAGILYLRTAARDIVVGDSAEFMNVALTLGVAHPPGYPLLTILGHVFSHIPVGSPEFRVNLLAVACGSATVGIIFLTARILGASRLSSAVASLALAVHPLFWEWSLAIEAFSLNNLLAASVVLFVVLWRAQPARAGFLVVAALCAGFAAANHHTMIFLIPSILLVLWDRRDYLFRSPKVVAACIGAVVVGLTPYAYLPWAASRNPFLNWGDISSFQELMSHFLRAAYGTGRLASEVPDPSEAGERLSEFARSFTLLSAPFVLAGAVFTFKRLRWYFWFSVLAFVLAGPAFVAYAQMSLRNEGLWVLQHFFVLPHVLVAPLVAFGFMWAVERVSAFRGGRMRMYAAPVLGAAAALLMVVSVARNYRTLDQSGNHLARTFAEDVLSSVEPGTVLMASNDEVLLPVAYLQAVEGRRPDVTLLILGLFRMNDGWYISQLRRRDPNLIIPFGSYNRFNSASTVRAMVDANPNRRFALIGNQLDNSLASGYWYYRRGLVYDVELMSIDIDLETAAREHERLYRTYRVPSAQTIKDRTFEKRLLRAYAVPPKLIGDEYRNHDLLREAAAAYSRAIAIDPSYTDAVDALARLKLK